MIGRLRGTLIHKQPPALMVDVSGVGYELEAPMSTFYELPEIGEETTLQTHLVVREDAQLLYGFATETERAMFRILIRVQRVGAKLALSILSAMSTQEFVQAIRDENSTGLARIPGVGKKTAERLIIEMRDRLKEWEVFSPDATSDATNNSPSTDNQASISTPHTIREEAVHALVALGYKSADASRLVDAVGVSSDASEENLSVEEIIRRALQQSVQR